MLTFENFKGVFTRAQKAHWVLYKGTSKNASMQIGSYFPEPGDEGIETSLNEICEIIERYGDGMYTIECRKSSNHSKGNDVHTFVVGQPADVGGIARTDKTPATTTPGFFQGLDAKFFMMNNMELQQQLHAAQMERLRLEMLLNQEKAERKREANEKQEPDAIGRILQNPVVVNRLFDALGVANTQTASRVGILKAETPQEPVFDDDGSDDNQDDYQPGQLDLNALFQDATRIQRALPDIHVNKLLEDLATYCEEKPDQARFVISQM